MSESHSQPPIVLSERWRWGSRQAISFLMEQGVDNPDILTLGAGLVDSETLPVAEVAQLVSEICRDPAEGRVALQYGSTPGSPRLRRALLQHLAALEGCPPTELGISADQLLLTTGSQQFLSLACEVLFNPGDIAFVASPTYFVFLGTLAGVGARAIPIRSDEHGMVIDDLDREIARLAEAGELHRVKMIYLVSDFENPSGICLSAERREQAVAVAKKWSKQQRIVILEDAAYRELRYSGESIPSIWSFDHEHQHVILAQTFSKSFSPGLRVGYGVVPAELAGPLADRKGNEDFGSAHFNQHLLARALESGIYTRHVARVRQAYTVKRDAMLAAAERYFSDIHGVHWVRPDGGLYVWMSLPAEISTRFESPLFKHATQQEHVMYVPGDLCYAGAVEDRRQHQMRLSFGVLEPKLIDEAMRRLSQAVRQFVRS
jgi:2-aminoadipate transaminase